jgi:hypothetical protein
MTDPSENAVHFEAVKISMTQDKTGYILKLAVHPNDVPETLLRDWVGARYVVALVKVADDGSIVVNADAAKGERAVKMAGLLCQTGEFQQYLYGLGIADAVGQESCIEGLRRHLGITSRAALKTNKAAREKFTALAGEFDAEQRRP